MPKIKAVKTMAAHLPLCPKASSKTRNIAPRNINSSVIGASMPITRYPSGCFIIPENN